MNRALSFLIIQIDVFVSSVRIYFKDNALLVALLASIAISAYGFELFNLNLTIDEEVHAFSFPGYQWISQGRWGMFLLNKFLIPYTVIPFVPLFVALVFHVAAFLMLLRSWGVKSNLEQITVGAIGVSYPGIAYMYTFSTINYGIGIGLFCVSLSLLIYSQSNGLRKFLAIIPATLAISIYQGLIVALACVFLVHFISEQLRAGRRNIDSRSLSTILCIGMLSTAAYYCIQKLFLFFTGSVTGYIEQFLDVGYLRNNLAHVFSKTLSTLIRVYSGDAAIYANEIRSLGVILVLALCGIAATLRHSALSLVNKLLMGFLTLALLWLPFTIGFLARGNVTIRFLVALPIVLSGLTMLGVRGQPRSFKIFVGVVSGFCVFQFVISTNYLFSSSHLALQADRLLASTVIGRIQGAKADADAKVLRYLEVVGYLKRPATKLIPKSETFGASFFEWDQGNVWRILFFLKTLGYQDLEAMPMERRSEMMEVANSMPTWPEKGSVKVVGDAAIIKFGDYSEGQKQAICEATRKREFCD